MLTVWSDSMIYAKLKVLTLDPEIDWMDLKTVKLNSLTVTVPYTGRLTLLQYITIKS